MNIPTNGLIFHASLKEASDTAQTGQTITWSGTQTVTVIDDIPCTSFNGSLYGIVDPSYNLNGDFTASCWWRQTGSKTEQRGVYMDYDNGTQHKAFTLQGWGNSGLVLGYGGQAYNVNLDYPYSLDTWYHLVAVCDRTKGISIAYINGVPFGTKNFTASQSLQQSLAIGATYSGGNKLTGYMAGVRIYNRALTPAQCYALYTEYQESSDSSSVPSHSGLLVNGLYLSALPPEKGSRGLLIDNVFFPLGVNDADEQIQTFTSSVMDLLGSYESDSGTSESASQSSSSALPIPSDSSLVLYMPMSEAKSTAETGQSIITTGTVTYQTKDGVPSVYLNGSSFLRIQNIANIPYGESPRTISIWSNIQVTSNQCIVGYGSQAAGPGYWQHMQCRTGVLWINGYADDHAVQVSPKDPADGQWHNIVLTNSSKHIDWYMDGEYVGGFDTTYGLPSQLNNVAVGHSSYSTLNDMLVGYAAALRVYNRILTANEIRALSREFTPVSA